METLSPLDVDQERSQTRRDDSVRVKRGTRIPQRVHAALLLMLESYNYAEDLDQDVWQFAVELLGLRELGLTNSDIRWLVGKGLVSHALEITLPGDGRRTFRECEHLQWSLEECLVLTDEGVAFSRDIADRELANLRAPLPWRTEMSIPREAATNGKPFPKWDRDRQELRVGNLIVKQFKVPAANQEAVLAAFEEEGWPARIDDPLPPHRDQDPKRRLHDTINSLNRNQKAQAIRFLGDGSGQGVRWELSKEAEGKRLTIRA